MAFWIFFLFFTKKTSVDISYELSAKQKIHMKGQDLQININKLEYPLLQILLGTLRVKKQLHKMQN